MGINIEEAVVGGVYAAGESHERRIEEITPDGRVRYLARSAGKAAWQIVPGLSTLPTKEQFAVACTRVISLPK